MTHRACSNCGAPLAAGQSLKVCEFCGVQIEPDPPPPPPPQPRVQPIVVHQFRSPAYVPQRSSGSPGIVIAAVMAVFGIAIAASVIAAVVGRSSSSSRSAESLPNIPGATGAGGKARVPLSALHTTPITWTTSVPIDASGMVGTLDHFDVLANWDWAVKVGKAWWSDAEMYEVSADPIGKDGTANVMTDGRIDYHLVSLDCRKDHQKRAETEKVEDSSCSLELTIDKNGPSVDLDLIAPDNTGNSHSLSKPTCTIAQAFDWAEKAGKLTKRPAYGIRLEHDVFGLQYRISNASSTASMDGVDVAPNFCLAKTPTPKGTTTAAVPTPTPTVATQGADIPVDRAAMAKAIKGVSTTSCNAKAGPTGSGHLSLTFAPNGTVSSAKTAPPFQGTDKGTCVEQAYSGLKIPAFTGSPVNASVTFMF